MHSDRRMLKSSVQSGGQLRTPRSAWSRIARSISRRINLLPDRTSHQYGKKRRLTSGLAHSTRVSVDSSHAVDPVSTTRKFHTARAVPVAGVELVKPSAGGVHTPPLGRQNRPSRPMTSSSGGRLSRILKPCCSKVASVTGPTRRRFRLFTPETPREMAAGMPRSARSSRTIRLRAKSAVWIAAYVDSAVACTRTRCRSRTSNRGR